jgi:hypothetical protein
MDEVQTLVVTDEMVYAAMDVYARGRPLLTWQGAVRASITAALKASGELERLRAELKRLQAERDSAILWIHRLANNPRKPSTWMETREAASNFLANLLQTEKDQPHD